MDYDREITALKASLEKSNKLISKLEAAQDAAVDVRRDKKATRGAIQQGVKAAVETVPMPVRLEVEQVKALKLLAATEGTTASAIIRGAIRQVLIESADGNPAFSAALKAAGLDV